jgi:hypothetical protein
VVRRSPGACRRSAFESEGCQFEFFDECVDNPHRIIFSDKVIETFRQECRLTALRTFDKSPHLRLSIQQVDSV